MKWYNRQKKVVTPKRPIKNENACPTPCPKTFISWKFKEIPPYYTELWDKSSEVTFRIYSMKVTQGRMLSN